MPQKVVTRFAPSPTGLLHGGNYRTAVFAYLFAKKMGGEFIVRIEDTDKARSKKEYEENILETLTWLKLSPDKLYRQSEHALRHRELLEKLIASGHAYVSKETEGERSEVIRFANPKTSVTFTDAIRGAITFDTTDLGDFVIARSLDEPVFHFAVVVDDADEGVTHVIRGEDHISNTPRQILIQKALGFSTPVYAHLPLVLSTDRSKLSKRRGAKALTEYREEGFLPEAILNYLALLGWHPEGDPSRQGRAEAEQEVFSLEELIQEFNLARIQKGSGVFDETKLLWFNQEHLRRLSDEEYAQRVGAEVKFVPLLKERAKTLVEAKELLKEFEYAEPSPELLVKGSKTDAAGAKTNLEKVRELLSSVSSEGFTKEEVQSAVFPYASEAGKAQVLWPMRTALSGREKSPDPFSLAELCGKDETLARIEKALQKL